MLATKGLSSLVATISSEIFTNWILYFVIFLLVLSAVVQLK